MINALKFELMWYFRKRKRFVSLKITLERLRYWRKLYKYRNTLPNLPLYPFVETQLNLLIKVLILPPLSLSLFYIHF